MHGAVTKNLWVLLVAGTLAVAAAGTSCSSSSQIVGPSKSGSGGRSGTGGASSGSGGSSSSGTGGTDSGTGGAQSGTGGDVGDGTGGDTAGGTGGDTAGGTGGDTAGGTGGDTAGTGGGAGGDPGTGGSVGTGGVPSSTGPLNCAAPKHVMATGLVTNFSDWNATTGRWGASGALQGSLFAYKGGPEADAGMPTANVVSQALSLRLVVTPGGYLGGGTTFNSCVDVSAYTMLTFTVAVTAGDLNGCSLQAQIQTFDQRPTSADPPGGCEPSASCFNFPAAAVTNTVGSAATPVSVPMASFSGWNDISPREVIGLQWQVNSSGGGCTPTLVIDDVRFQ